MVESVEKSEEIRVKSELSLNVTAICHRREEGALPERVKNEW